MGVFLFPFFEGVTSQGEVGVVYGATRFVIFRKRSPAFRYIFFVHISTPLNITKKDAAAIGARKHFSVFYLKIKKTWKTFDARFARAEFISVYFALERCVFHYDKQ